MNVIYRACVVGLVMAGCLATVPVFAQTPGKLFTRETSFRMPIEIAPAERQALREIRLYVRGPGDETWKMVSTGGADQDSFHFEARSEGEYAFGFVTVAHDGTAYPMDLNAVPPAVVVVVDTTRPEVNLKAQHTANGDTFLRVAVSDANPDPQAMSVQYRDSEGHWRTLRRYKGEFFEMTDPSIANATVRVTGKDRAGNEIVSETQLNVATVMNQPTPPKPAWDERPPITPKQPTIHEPEIELASSSQQMTVGQASVQSTEAEAPPKTIAPPELPPIPASTEVPMPQLEPEPVLAGDPTLVKKPELPRVEATMIDSTQFSLDYAVESLGLSPRSRIEFWYTTDLGVTWKLMGSDPDRVSPANLTLPGDGLYGVFAQVGTGDSASVPPQNQTPDFWLEVDSTTPVVSLGEATVGTGADAGSVSIVWTALDRNLTNEAVSLYYAKDANGPWTQIASKLGNDGIYRWRPDADVTGQVYLRIRVEDAAGNVGRFDSPTPITIGQ